MIGTRKDDYLHDFEEFHRVARNRPHDYSDLEIAVLYIGYLMQRR